MGQILDGRVSAKKIYDKLTLEIERLKEEGIIPFLAVVLVGNDVASQVYVKRKEQIAKQIGLATKTFQLSATTTEKELLALIEKLNNDRQVHGILVQFPLPKQIDEIAIVEAIDPKKDADGFHPYNVGKLVENQPTLIPCTPAGVIQLLDDYKINLQGKNCVIIGRSSIVGKPISTMLLHRDATITICHSKTKNLMKLTKEADLIVAAVGKANFLKPEMINNDTILIDVGINRTENGLVGDIDPKCYLKASAYTPVPGGVGPMTIAMLMQQTVEIAKRRGVKNE